METLAQQALFGYVLGNGAVDYSGFDSDTRDRVREVGVRNLFLQRRLKDVVAALGQRGISPIVLKGGHLIHTIYPFGVRPVEDIDLVIDPAEMPVVDEVLRAMGYVSDVVGMDHWTHVAFSHKITYTNDANPMIPIDLHFALGPHPYLGRMNHALLMANSEVIATQAGPIRVLVPELLLIHLCLHLFQHHFDTWQVSCCDIVTLIRQQGEQIDWAKFCRLVNQHQLGLPVRYSLAKAAEFAQIKIPASVETGIGQPSRLERWVFRTCMRESAKTDRYLLQFVTTPGVVTKLRVMLRMVAPGRAYLRLNHGDSYLRYLADASKTVVKLMRLP